MKIYFAGSIRGGRGDQELYFSIIKELGKYGTVLTEHVGSKTSTVLGEEFVTEGHIYERDMSWLRECDVVFAEVTTPSLGVGYEVGRAEAMGKKVICIYRHVEGKSLSAMISGNPVFLIYQYKDFADLVEFFKDQFIPLVSAD